MSTGLVLYLAKMDNVYIPQPISKKGACEGWNIQVSRNVASPTENCISWAPSSPLSQAHCEAIDFVAFQNIGYSHPLACANEQLMSAPSYKSQGARTPGYASNWSRALEPSHSMNSSKGFAQAAAQPQTQLSVSQFLETIHHGTVGPMPPKMN